MIRNPDVLRAFERGLIAGKRPDHMRGLAMLDAMLEESIRMKRFPPENRLEGIEVDIRIARVINSV